MNGLQEKELKTYFFSSDGGGVTSTDISSLDVENDNPLIAEWGGLSAFSGKASEVVGKYYQEPELREDEEKECKIRRDHLHYWIPSGKVCISKTSPQYRSLAKHNLQITSSPFVLK